VPYASGDDPTAGQNPPYGADINYFLKSQTRNVSIKIVDAGGQTIQTIRGTGNAGLNRVWWNLRNDQSKEVRLRTSPLYAPEIRVNAEGWRPLPEGGRMNILMPPGTYTVKLSVDGQEVGSQPLKVLIDPNAGGSDADIQAQTAMLTALRKDLESAADMTNQIEMIRGQLESMRQIIRDASVKSAADDLEKKLADIEDNLIQRKFSGQGQDTTRYPTKLIGKLTYLAGDVSDGDYPPNTQEKEVQAMFESQLADLRKRLDVVVSTDVAAFNRMLRDKNIGNVIAAGP
jgi:hypothetical protein